MLFRSTRTSLLRLGWFCLRELGRDARHLCGVKLAAIGPGTAKALADRGLTADLVPGTYDAAHLGGALADAARGKVLLLRAAEGSAALTDALARKGIAYDDIAVYQTLYLFPYTRALRKELEAGKIDAVTFTSASTVRGFLSTVGADADFSQIGRAHV